MPHLCLPSTYISQGVQTCESHIHFHNQDPGEMVTMQMVVWVAGQGTANKLAEKLALETNDEMGPSCSPRKKFINKAVGQIFTKHLLHTSEIPACGSQLGRNQVSQRAIRNLQKLFFFFGIKKGMVMTLLEFSGWEPGMVNIFVCVG